MSGIQFDGAILRGSNFSYTNLTGIKFVNTSLENACFINSDVSNACFQRAILRDANFSNANLRGAFLEEAILVGTNLRGADLSGSRVYGVSAWNVNLEGAKQNDLIITPENEPTITVDNLQVAQSIYLMLRNSEIRNVIDVLGKKAVLILGRFNDRKAVLDAIRNELRDRNFLPILFDFDKPTNRNLTETITILGGLARFVIADLSDPHSIPQELQAIVERFIHVPVQPIFSPVSEHPNEYPMFSDLRGYSHVLPIYRYKNQRELFEAFDEHVIKPAEKRLNEMR